MKSQMETPKQKLLAIAALLAALTFLTVGALRTHEVAAFKAPEPAKTPPAPLNLVDDGGPLPDLPELPAETPTTAPTQQTGPTLTISEAQMVVDATGGGLLRVKGELQSTYDRSKPRGKAACPT